MTDPASSSSPPLEFVVLSFEGPDHYSMVGGLGVRVTEMTRVLAELGHSCRLFFIGDPEAKPVETHVDGKLTLHRWSRWVSAEFPKGVYEGELAKVEDFQNSLPSFLVEHVLTPNAERGVTTVVLGEDWQTAATLIRTENLARDAGLCHRILFLWNANNTFGFEGIDWAELTKSAHLLTVSRYMKERMRSLELEPLVVSNGIPERFWAPVDKKAQRKLGKIFGEFLITKVGRYHPDKRWMMAIESAAECKFLGLQPKLVVRGGREAYGEEIRAKAESLGLIWAKVTPEGVSTSEILKSLEAVRDADVIELDFFVPESFLRVLYAASLAVLANSGHEPFGLVGLEVMACGGVAITGSTGEEYLQSFTNGIALGSDDHREITVYLRELLADEQLQTSLRERARETSKLFAWEVVLRDLFRKVGFISKVRDVLVD